MINQEIFQGIKFALTKKQSLKFAMESFYNAGYKKEEIEEAARAVQIEQFEQKVNAPSDTQKAQAVQPTQQIQPVQTSISVPKTEKKILPPLTQPPKEKATITPLNKNPAQIKKNVQKVSQYEQPQTKPKKDVFAIVLIFILLLLLGILAAVFLFKAELLEFFNRFL